MTHEDAEFVIYRLSSKQFKGQDIRVNWAEPNKEEESKMFAEIISLPKGASVFDLTGISVQNYDSTWGIGKYNEHRPNIYNAKLFDTPQNEKRCFHLGIDLFGPAGTPVFSFADAEVLNFGYNAAEGDYGYVFILEVHLTETLVIYALYGHLSKESILNKYEKKKLKKGETIGWLGDKHENGGWPSHVHFQLSWEKPTTHDLPGTCTRSDLQISLLKYPDPRLVLGPIY